MAASVVGTVSQGGSRYRVVKGVEGVPGPVVEKHIGEDCLGVDGWQRLTPQSDPRDIWNALQAALSRL